MTTEPEPEWIHNAALGIDCRAARTLRTWDPWVRRTTYDLYRCVRPKAHPGPHESACGRRWSQHD